VNISGPYLNPQAKSSQQGVAGLATPLRLTEVLLKTAAYQLFIYDHMDYNSAIKQIRE
jgi:hypothetical protein